MRCHFTFSKYLTYSPLIRNVIIMPLKNNPALRPRVRVCVIYMQMIQPAYYIFRENVGHENMRYFIKFYWSTPLRISIITCSTPTLFSYAFMKNMFSVVLAWIFRINVQMLCKYFERLLFSQVFYLDFIIIRLLHIILYSYHQQMQSQ